MKLTDAINLNNPNVKAIIDMYGDHFYGQPNITTVCYDIACTITLNINVDIIGPTLPVYEIDVNVYDSVTPHIEHIEKQTGCKFYIETSAFSSTKGK